MDYPCLQVEYRLCELKELGEDELTVYDESKLEKPESMAITGLSLVHSSKADRLKRIKLRYYNPPGSYSIFVPEMHWIGILLMGRSGPPTVATRRW